MIFFLTTSHSHICGPKGRKTCTIFIPSSLNRDLSWTRRKACLPLNFRAFDSTLMPTEMGELIFFFCTKTNVFLTLSTKLLDFFQIFITVIMHCLFFQHFPPTPKKCEGRPPRTPHPLVKLVCVGVDTSFSTNAFTPLQVGHRQMNVTEKQVEILDIGGVRHEQHSGAQGRYGSAGA